MMNAFKTLAITGTIIMFLTLVYGFAAGYFFEEGGILLSMPWGKVSLVDVYTGFFLFSGWVLYREEKWTSAVIWILAIMVLGNFITCLYVTMALFKCNDDFKIFWLGKHFQH
ncbi:MAG: DUF1475 family protein [Bacteroidota bacterium]